MTDRQIKHFTGPIEVDLLKHQLPDPKREYNHLLMATQGMEKRAIATVHPRPEWEGYCAEANAKIFANAHNMFDLLARFERITTGEGPVDPRQMQLWAADVNELLEAIAPKIETPKIETQTEPPGDEQ